jgi:hypothetical protein
MKRIWRGDGTSEAFREEFERWADENGGVLQERDEKAVFCEFDSSPNHESFEIGVYEANGQHVLRFDTIREEIELKVLSEYSIDGSTLVVKSDQGSRQFEIDVQSGNWSVRKRPI